MNIEIGLITACINKERKAQYDLYKLSYSFLMGICNRYVHSPDEADDLLNKGFLKVLNNLGKYRLEIPFGVWMRRVMINVIIDEYRKNRKHKDTIVCADDHHTDDISPQINGALSQMDVDQIHFYIGKLPNISSKVFNLFVIDGYSHKEIADMLKMSEGTSKWHLNFSRQKLKEMITNKKQTIKNIA